MLILLLLRAKNFARALPQLEPVAAEKARLQFLQDLKTDIRVRFSALSHSVLMTRMI